MTQPDSLPRVGMTVEELKRLMGEPSLVLSDGSAEKWVYITPRGELRMRVTPLVTELIVSYDE